MKASVLRFVAAGALAAGVAGLTAGGCAEKKVGYLAETSDVIYARQRTFGFVFKVKSPGGALNNQELRQFVDAQKSGFKALYQPKKLDDFGVQGRGGVIDAVDVAYEGGMAGYDDVVLLEGDVTADRYAGRMRIINSAGGGAVFDQKLEVNRAGMMVGEGKTARPAASIGEAAWISLRPLLVQNYKNPMDYELLRIQPAQKYEGVEGLAKVLIAKAGVTGVAGFVALARPDQDEKYRYLNYAQKLLAKVLDAYTNGTISGLGPQDTVRIQEISRQNGLLTQITGYYEDEVAVNIADFKVSFDFQNVNETFQKYFQDAFKASTFEQAIRLYTGKPAVIAVTYDVKADSGTIYLKIRYSSPRFLAALQGKRLITEDSRLLPFDYFNRLMGEFYKYRFAVLKGASEFDQKSLGKFTLVLELQRKLLGYAQIPVSVYDGKLRPITELQVQLCNYPVTPVPTAKANFTQEKGYYVLGAPQNVAGQRVAYANVYEFFDLDSLFGVTYPKACGGNEQIKLDVRSGFKGPGQSVTVPR